MKRPTPVRDNELREAIAEKLTVLFREMEEADWDSRDIAITINDVLRERWLDAIEAANTATKAMPGNFISDGNEG